MIRFAFELALNGKQKDTISGIFSAPEFLLDLIKSEKPNIRSKMEASIFLLKNKKKVDLYISQNNREASIDLLTELLIEWSKSPPESVSIDFTENCSISKNNEFFVSYLGFLLPKKTQSVSDALSLGKYRKEFCLVKKKDLYFLEVDFDNSVKNVRKVEVAPKTTKNPSNKNKGSIGINVYVEMFDKAVEKYLKAELKIAQQYTKTNFDELKGWHVQGGLPSLGKKR